MQEISNMKQVAFINNVLHEEQMYKGDGKRKLYAG
jgi:hypothetical protein